MKSIQCFNRGFRPFAMFTSAKQLVTGILFASMLFLSPSLRSDIAVYTQTSSLGGGSYNGATPIGNTFSNINQATTLKLITLYMANDSSGASGTLRLNIYEATTGTGPYTYTGGILGFAELNLATVGGTDFYSFGFSRGPSLEANKRYAFMTDISHVNDANYMRFYNNGGTFEGQNLIEGSIGQDRSILGEVFVETTAVPEPGTLILTGSALLAGAIGVYFTRRHKDQALTPAAV
jgi:hypothetical protein